MNNFFNKNRIHYLALLICFVITSCAKDGDIGPKGEKGERGIRGDDGNFLFSGTTNPISKGGKIGDFYLNLVTGVLFGPKTEDGWGVGFSLKGENGHAGNAGPAGAEILHGEGAPAIELGKIGDFYFDTKLVVFYGPKMEVINEDGTITYDWGIPISIRAEELSNVRYQLLRAQFKYDVSLVGNKIEAYSQQNTISFSTIENQNSDNVFMEFFYTVKQANVSYPSDFFLHKWTKMKFETMDIEDVRINSDQTLKNVKLTLLVEKINRSQTDGYWYSCRLNATVPTPNYSTISGEFIDILVKIHDVSPIRIGKANPTQKDLKRFLRIN